MGVLVKICGINAAEAADAAARAGADFAGLNFHPKSPRCVSPEAARSLAERLRGRARLVAILCDADDEAIAAAVSAANPDFVQLHGHETAERAAAIRARFGKPVIKVFPVADKDDFAEVPRFEAVADMFLFDAKAPSNAAISGGRGVAFDWQLLRGRSFPRPWLLAGGLDAENVARAIAVSGAPGVDAASGVETAPGVKSAEKIAAFVANARAAQYAKTEERG